MSKIGSWSVSADQNTAAAPNGFPENMAPSGVNDAAREVMARVKEYCNDAEWFDRDMTPTYVNANSFTLVGDQTGVMLPGRALKLYDASGTAQPIYRFIMSASFTAVTTLQLESGQAITSSLTSFATSVLAPRGQIRAAPQMPVVNLRIGVPQSVSNNTTVIYQASGDNMAVNTYSWYDRTTGRFTPQWAGWYHVNAYVELTGLFSATNAARLNVTLSASGTAQAVATFRGVVGMGSDIGQGLLASGIAPFNGSTDAAYVTYQNAGGSQVASSLSYVNIYYLGK